MLAKQKNIYKGKKNFIPQLLNTENISSLWKIVF